MSTRTPAEKACFDALVEHNKPMDRDGGDTYPSCLWPIAEAATKAVLDADQEHREQLHELRHEYAATHCPRCGLPTRHGQPDGEAFCDGCGWEA